MVTKGKIFRIVKFHVDTIMRLKNCPLISSSRYISKGGRVTANRHELILSASGASCFGRLFYYENKGRHSLCPNIISFSNTYNNYYYVNVAI